MVRVFERVEATYDIHVAIDWPRLLPKIKTLIGYLLSEFLPQTSEHV